MIWRTKLKSAIGSLEARLQKQELETSRISELLQQREQTLGEISGLLQQREHELREISGRLQQRERELSSTIERYEELGAHVNFLHNPESTRGAQQLAGFLLSRNRPLPDDFQERALRLQLRQAPYDLNLTYSLVALLHRTGMPPLPDPKFVTHDALPSDMPDIETLIQSGHDQTARTGDVFRLYAALWQACVRFPGSPRGWAEFARSFADRGEWEHCLIAARHVLAADMTPDVATGTAMLRALSTLGEEGRLADLPWQNWVLALPSDLHAHPDLANLLLAARETDRAAALVPKFTAQWPEKVETWIVAASIAHEQENIAAAYELLLRAFELDFPRALHSVVRTFTGRLDIVRQLGKLDEFIERMTKLARKHKDAHIIPAHPSPESFQDAHSRRRRALERGLPPALMVTMGKSASVSIGNILSSGFDLPTVLYSIMSFGAIEPWLKDFLDGGSYYANHLSPSARNVEMLAAAAAPSVIVNVRDPRQQMISMVEHVRRYSSMTLPSLRAKVSGGPDNGVAFALEEFFPMTLSWIDGWVKARAQLTIHFTTFEEFVRDRDQFVDRLVSIYGGDTRFFNRQAALQEHTGIDYHRRLGSVDEWRSILSPQQTERVNSQIPNEYWNLFGWTP